MKTKPNEGDVTAFLDGITDPQRRADAKAAHDLISEATGASPKMWGASIVGFGDYHYSYESGREGDTFVVGFSPRKASLTLYLMDGFEKYGDLLDQLGKHSTGKARLYIKRMSDIPPLSCKKWPPAHTPTPPGARHLRLTRADRAG